ncbi:beta-xylosidase [Curtobacterium flaccumfaciens]|nr:glycoside hydrolase family 3 N-terminal domain-containing protein [Curtobacterium flaccumfaciens]MDQ0538360.1 beta-xylosidase [Curtobacterium flaccumfaciens]
MTSIDTARIVSKMTLEQKVAQLRGLFATELFVATPEKQGIDPARVAVIRPHGVGHISMAWFLAEKADELRSQLGAIQEHVRETAPFGIGAMVHFEAINGVVHDSGPQFPTAWAQAASWNPGLIRQAAAVSSALTEEIGGHAVFSPVMDLARDPRWGRVHETYGEDPELVAQCSVAFVEGIQGRNGERPILATGKHFLGYGASEGGLNQAVTQLGRRALVDEYAEPFRRAIAEADLALIMNSYNEVDGVPAAANRWMLTELLREDLGFTGPVVSDYSSIAMLRTVYHTAPQVGDAARHAVEAGLDADLPGGEEYATLVEEVQSGRLDERVIDVAVERTLVAKARAGLIPEFRRASSAPRVDRDEAADIRRTIAEQSLVLLSNDGVLPLSNDRAKIVVVGPAADELRIHFGAYTSVSNIEMMRGSMALRAGEIPGVTAEEAIFTDIFQARMPGIEPTFEEAAKRLHPDARTLLDALQARHADISFVELGDLMPDAAPLNDVTVANAIGDADLVIAALGERTGWVGNNTAGEGQSTSEPRLPGNQEQLVSLLARAGVPIVSVIVTGRPLLLTDVVEASSAVLIAPLLGEEGGETLARALFGDVNPSGKLPNSFPRSIGQIPIYHGHHMGSGYDHPTGIRHGYNDLTLQAPLFAFGHGLSYTKFDLDSEGVGSTVGPDAQLALTVTVRNTGSRAGDTVVQLYTRDEEASVVRPVRQLVAFERVGLDVGEAKTITLSAPVARLAFTGLDNRRVVEAGRVTLSVGFASDDIRATSEVEIVSSSASV